MSNLEIKMVPVGDLGPHPLFSMTGMMDALISRERKKGKESGKERDKHRENAEILESRYAALKNDIAENGVREPLKICKAEGGFSGCQWHIADGRHRWMSAREAGHKEVPCMIVTAGDAKDVVLSALLGKPVSKGALAYTAVSLYPEVCETQNGGDRKSDSVSESDFTQASLAKKSGVGVGTMNRAVEVYKMLHNTGAVWPKGYSRAGDPMYVPGAAAKFENAIFVPNIGLGGVKAGIIHFRDTGDTGDDESESANPTPKDPDLTATRQIATTLRKQRDYWAKADKKKRKQIIEVWATELSHDESMMKALIERLTQTAQD